MRKKEFMAMILSLTLTLCLGTCGVVAAESDTEPSTITETSEEASAAAESEAPVEEASAAAESEAPVEEASEAAEGEASVEAKLTVNLPEDDGLAGIYNWVEMEEYGVPTYLILWDDGVGSIDLIGTGTVRGVFYDEETMQVADEGTVPQKYTYADDKLTWTYTDESGEHVSNFIRLTAEERAAYEALGVGSVAKDEENKEEASPWPEDNGGLAGVYKWVEMEEIGVTANLILFDDGTGIFDILGVLETVTYDDETMQSSGEGALPQSYTYEDGTLTWVTKDEEAQVSTFVKLTADELAEYEARGVGNAE